MNRLALLLSLGALVLAGCSGGFSERDAAANEGTFTYPIVDNPTSLDPAVVRDGDTLDMLQQVYEGLVTWSEDNEVIPLLADRWELQEDGRTYVFHLKKGVKFHSGKEVKAEDFKWSFERACNPERDTGTAAGYLIDIVGVQERIDGKAEEVTGIQVIDDYTLQIQIDKPRPYFLGKLTYLVSAVVDKDVVPQLEEIGKPEEMVGTGPFKCVQYVPQQTTVLEAFADYHGGAPKLKKIERPVVKDATMRLNKYRNGELDLVMLERQDIDAINADKNLKPHLKLFPRPATWYIGMNQKTYKPFADVRVRRAFAMAIDKESIVNGTLGGVNQVAHSIIPPGVKFHRESANDLKYNPEEAKKLLADAGYPGGRGLPPLTMRFRAQRPDIKLVGEAVVTQLQKNLGITPKIVEMEWRAYLDMENAGQLELYHMRWGADYLDGQNFLSHMIASFGPENSHGYNNPRFDELCRQADSSLVEDERARLYAEAEDIALQEAAWIPIYFQKDAELIQPHVKGLRESLFGHLPHTTVWIEKE